MKSVSAAFVCIRRAGTGASWLQALAPGRRPGRPALATLRTAVTTHRHPQHPSLVHFLSLRPPCPSKPLASAVQSPPSVAGKAVQGHAWRLCAPLQCRKSNHSSASAPLAAITTARRKKMRQLAFIARSPMSRKSERVVGVLVTWLAKYVAWLECKAV